jgi:hypothetical protein
MSPSSSDGSANVILKNQPSSIGSSLTSAGFATIAVFTSVTCPSRGAEMSLAALTDSIVTTPSPFTTVRPSSGSSTKTRSPSCSAACSVIPTITSSPSCFSHSCSSVYRSIPVSVQVRL